MKRLFSAEDDLKTYAILDGASIPELLDQLYGDVRPEFVCLYRGELEPDIAEVAPYLVCLKPNEPFTDWLLTQGWGKHWCIFAFSSTNLNQVRTHFRRFLMVKDSEGSQIYFRFYDPRVLPVFLPTCYPDELKFLFGPLTEFLCEGESPDRAKAFSLANGQLATREEKINV